MFRERDRQLIELQEDQLTPPTEETKRKVQEIEEEKRRKEEERQRKLEEAKANFNNNINPQVQEFADRLGLSVEEWREKAQTDPHHVTVVKRAFSDPENPLTYEEAREDYLNEQTEGFSGLAEDFEVLHKTQKRAPYGLPKRDQKKVNKLLSDKPRKSKKPTKAELSERAKPWAERHAKLHRGTRQAPDSVIAEKLNVDRSWVADKKPDLPSEPDTDKIPY